MWSIENWSFNKNQVHQEKNSTRNDNLQKHVVLCGEHESKSETGLRIFAEK